MSSTIESMHGILHEVSAKLSNLYAAQCLSRSAGSVHKRSRNDDSSIAEIQSEPALLQEEPIAKNISVASIFSSHFKPSAAEYNPATLSQQPIETFIYDWYTKGLGTVKEKEVRSQLIIKDVPRA